MMQFSAPDPQLFFSKNDAQDRRMGDLVEKSDEPPQLEKHQVGWCLFGYPDDEGVRLNGGRVGAALGPDGIRRVFYKLTPPTDTLDAFVLFDGGNLKVNNELNVRHSVVEQNALEMLQKGWSYIGLGGGHDYAYGDGAAFLRWCQTNKRHPIVLNFDAHLDVRPTEGGLSSGTPFYRLLNQFDSFDFFELGIQSQCNSVSHLAWAKERGARILMLDEVNGSHGSLITFLNQDFKKQLKDNSALFISIDIDGFDSSYAMGCSQSWPVGFFPEAFLMGLRWLRQNADVRMTSIYEVAPPMDIDERTCKLAAVILHQLLFANLE